MRRDVRRIRARRRLLHDDDRPQMGLGPHGGGVGPHGGVLGPTCTMTTAVVSSTASPATASSVSSFTYT